MIAVRAVIPTRSRELPAACAELATRLHATPLTELPEDEILRLSERYDAAVAGPDTDENEILRLLTRPFSRHLDIPEYYRYTGLHVVGWYLARREDSYEASLLLLHALVTDLIALEEREAGLHETTVEEGAERVRRLKAVLDHLGRSPVSPDRTMASAELVRLAGHDDVLVRDLLVVNRCSGFRRSGKHDEHIFMRAVQACEIGFFLVRWTARRATEAIGRGRGEYVLRMSQLTSAAELLNVVFHALRTLTPELFMGFREATGSASAVQSLNYHLMELVMYGYDERKIETYERFAHLAPINDPLFREFTSLRDAAAGTRDADVREAFAASEAPLHIWRGRHYGFGRRYLPEMTGSGGTEGAGYLKRFVRKAGLASGDRTDDAEQLLTQFAFC
ncbi:tryptophan 2,3-dioxygenase family protein [Streptomyces sp. XD-27]|uniref:tryptophan 2,3-dioxygenase family protein n=1 Tax=Streptomyces sp. XD-27 TaxID=3062779 RepID=UPI0026F47773|nr:tryptophan 2,3-dioxygenase family protein [Streptomyces sp. XD-27]WKX74040.1 tryptophan 2,3-dioxygenase family protein [Streptomyces sp. XD-27]